MPIEHGEVKHPGFLGRLFDRRVKIVRDADIEAAIESLPREVAVVNTDPSENWVLYQMSDGALRIRFRAKEAWFPNEPTLRPNRTVGTVASINPDGRVVVTEGLHRTRAMARGRVMLDPKEGGVEKAPGWLDFAYDPSGLIDTPSVQAISQLLGGNPNRSLVPAR